MNMIAGILIATICVAAVGLFVGLFLGFAGKKFAVEVDEREEKILSALPGANCGGCGQAGCAAMAHSIVEGNSPVNGCPVGGEAVAAQIAEIMGQKVEKTEPMAAFVKCSGTCSAAKTKYEYTGVLDCKYVAMTPGKGPKACSFGCLGGGTCVRVCAFDAIHIVDGIAVVDTEKCKACGKCVENCPQHLIELKPVKNKYAVGCSSKDKGPAVMKVCTAGCIGCGLCQKNCPKDAIHVTDFVAHIDYEKCVSCGICAQKCPKKVITKL
ncbi:MAG: RnfABCDGE type electron transport complex subunit B [Lachnospiraceae bacterium]|nr:RnfABCDGE type electron transport complex subunit B [Lachnospiraceae bacterium]